MTTKHSGYTVELKYNKQGRIVANFLIHSSLNNAINRTFSTAVHYKDLSSISTITIKRK